MSNRNNIFDEGNLGKEAPILASIPKRNPYTVPDGYFDTLPHSIIEKCRETTQRKSLVNIFWLFRPQWMVASLVLIIGATFYLRSNSPATLETLTAQVSDSAIYQSLQNNIAMVDVNSLEDALPNEKLSAVEPLHNDSTTTQQQDIENYLMTHNVNASDIENEL